MQTTFGELRVGDVVELNGFQYQVDAIDDGVYTLTPTVGGASFSGSMPAETPIELVKQADPLPEIATAAAPEPSPMAANAPLPRREAKDLRIGDILMIDGVKSVVIGVTTNADSDLVVELNDGKLLDGVDRESEFDRVGTLDEPPAADGEWAAIRWGDARLGHTVAHMGIQFRVAARVADADNFVTLTPSDADGHLLLDQSLTRPAGAWCWLLIPAAPTPAEVAVELAPDPAPEPSLAAVEPAPDPAESAGEPAPAPEEPTVKPSEPEPENVVAGRVPGDHIPWADVVALDIIEVAGARWRVLSRDGDAITMIPDGGGDQVTGRPDPAATVVLVDWAARHQTSPAEGQWVAATWAAVREGHRVRTATDEYYVYSRSDDGYVQMRTDGGANVQGIPAADRDVLILRGTGPEIAARVAAEQAADAADGASADGVQETLKVALARQMTDLSLTTAAALVELHMAASRINQVEPERPVLVKPVSSMGELEFRAHLLAFHGSVIQHEFADHAIDGQKAWHDERIGDVATVYHVHG